MHYTVHDQLGSKRDRKATRCTNKVRTEKIPWARREANPSGPSSSSPWSSSLSTSRHTCSRGPPRRPFQRPGTISRLSRSTCLGRLFFYTLIAVERWPWAFRLRRTRPKDARARARMLAGGRQASYRFRACCSRPSASRTAFLVAGEIGPAGERGTDSPISRILHVDGLLRGALLQELPPAAARAGRLAAEMGGHSLGLALRPGPRLSRSGRSRSGQPLRPIISPGAGTTRRTSTRSPSAMAFSTRRYSR